MPLSLDELNDEQRDAVLSTEGPLLVLAGAGSGKTRVLTYRIARIVESLGVSPYEILAITFTNKAAAEMRERLDGLLGSTRGMWVSTFHAMGVRILRRDADRLGYTRDFTIYDEDDMKRLLKAIYADLNLDSRTIPINGVRSRISAAKNALRTPEQYASDAAALGMPAKVTAKVYAELARRMKASNAMDFDDLLVCTYRLLETNPDVLNAYQERFRYILVDEYQDTNHVQYLLVHLLAKKYRNVMVVGDDDQSIYSWRGADVRNILEFERDYTDAKVVKLERNYRSTGNILGVANSIVSHNENRKSKHLYTDEGDGEDVCVYLAPDEREEGRWIANEIERLSHAQPGGYNDFAVLYRTNAQSRVIEDMFLRAGIPYRIVAGTRFFDRAEIRDVMAYLKVVVNPADEISAKRIINTPRRGIGDKTIARLDSIARQAGVSFMEAARLASADESFTPHLRRALLDFCNIFDEARTFEGELRDVIEAIVDKTGLISALKAEGTDEALGRVENIREFYGVVSDYDESHADDEAEQSQETEDIRPSALPATGLSDFMAWLALRTDLDSLSADGSSVVLMTVHSAKGLEFPVVFVAGMEESIFPHMNVGTDVANLEEERRLAYVAVTRARKRLVLTYARKRSLYGSVRYNPCSRFISEMGEKGVKRIGAGSDGFVGVGNEKRGSRHGMYGDGTSSQASAQRVFGQGNGAGKAAVHASAQEQLDLSVGDRVDHKVFGRGTVARVDGDVLYITFADGKSKKLLKGYTPLVKIS